MTRKNTALLLNAFVLPGLGQLYIGRKVIGVAILMLVNLLLLITLFVVLKGLSPIIAAKVLSGPVTTNEVLTALQGAAGAGKALLAAFAALWAFAIVDLVRMPQS